MRILPVFIPQQGCPFNCIYCDQKQFGSVESLPLSELARQVEAFCKKNSDSEKQIAFYGGTFTGLAAEERERYYQVVQPFLDDRTTLRISTRPDEVSKDQLDWCRQHQVRTIELGIQDFSDVVLKASERGYSHKTAMEACLRVKQNGFELGVQIMPGLPGSNSETMRDNLEALEEIKPQFLRLYPLVVLSGTALWDEWQAGRYKPLSLEEAIDICIRFSEQAEKANIKVIKTGIPSLAEGTLYAGPYHPALGELVRIEKIIRKTEAANSDGSEAALTEAEHSLLKSHQGYGLKRLQQRLVDGAMSGMNGYSIDINSDNTRSNQGGL